VEWEEFAPGLKTLEDATEIRRRILLAFETAEREVIAHEKRGRSVQGHTVLLGLGIRTPLIIVTGKIPSRRLLFLVTTIESF
jgi:hypothetical protein